MVLTELLKDLLNVVVMVGQVPGVDEDIIDVNDQEELTEHSFINPWKMDGALARPYGITRYS